MRGMSSKTGVADSPGKEHPAQKLIRAAEMSGKKGAQTRQIGEVPTPAEQLGLALGVLRRRKKISVDELANRAGCSPEALIALEAGLLPVDVTGKVLPGVVKAMGIDTRRLSGRLPLRKKLG